MDFASAKLTPIQTYQNGQIKETSQLFPIEVSTDIYINNSYKGTLVSSPHQLESLAIGYCLSAGILHSYQEIKSLTFDASSKRIDIETTDSPDVLVPIPSNTCNPTEELVFSAQEFCQYGELLNTISETHHSTHGVHEGAIIKDGKILLYAEDIGRHNVLDRLHGLAAQQHIDLRDKILVFSGRVPLAVITKIKVMQLPVILSRATATSAAIEYAEKYDITLINRLRTNGFLISAHGERVQA